MGITSLGIFGFLTGAYQQSHVKVELTDTKQEALQSKKQFLQEQIASLTDRVKTLNEARKAQEKRLPDMSSKAAKPIYDDIKRSGDEINTTRAKIDDLSNQLLQTSQDSISNKIESSKEADIGTLKYVAKTFNVDMDTIVKWFTLAIVCVFDPLAVALILAYNSLIEKKQSVIQEENPEEEVVTTKKVSRIRKAVNNLINYRV
jgi:hypothetical protein